MNVVLSAGILPVLEGQERIPGLVTVYELHQIFARQGEEIKTNNLTQEKVMKTISFGALGSRN